MIDLHGPQPQSTAGNKIKVTKEAREEDFQLAFAASRAHDTKNKLAVHSEETKSPVLTSPRKRATSQHPTPDRVALDRVPLPIPTIIPDKFDDDVSPIWPEQSAAASTTLSDTDPHDEPATNDDDETAPTPQLASYDETHDQDDQDDQAAAPSPAQPIRMYNEATVLAIIEQEIAKRTNHLLDAHARATTQLNEAHRAHARHLQVVTLERDHLREELASSTRTIAAINDKLEDLDSRLVSETLCQIPDLTVTRQALQVAETQPANASEYAATAERERDAARASSDNIARELAETRRALQEANDARDAAVALASSSAQERATAQDS
ncbi:hypothetical protein ACHHYP_15335 [Achlya hypogyna]|uniref:Uncharacterized protein n=1 Tax=Achlya hypogyna TaxID=1202772 RepID=A0A1V9YB40_ACHHY|nr:hypothetical protein ACHHYP_15335 [Achlya hypogyna]